MSDTDELILTGQCNELPLGWKLATIKDLVRKGGVFIDGDWVESKDQDPDGDVRLIQLADIGDGEYKNKSARFMTYEKALQLGCTFLKKGDVLIARMPDPLGRACIFPGDTKPAVTVVDIAIVRSSAGEFNHRWLMYFVNAPLFRAAIASMQSGSTRKRISRGNLAKIALPVPPLDQQKLIVAEIEKQFSRLDEAVANLKRVKANLKRYKAAVLKAAVEGRLVETEAELGRREGRSFETGEQLLQRILENRRSQWKGKGKYKEPAAPDTTNLPELPEGWVWASAEQVSDFITKGTTPSAEKLSAGGGDVQFLKVYNLTFDGSLNASYKAAFVSKHTHESELARSKVQPGDVLINIVGPPLGQVSVVPATLPVANINQAIARFRPIQPISTGYLTLTLRTEDIMQWALRRAKTTAGQSNLTLELCRALPIPLPPVAEQESIVVEVERRLSLVRGVETQVVANLKRAERLRQSILARSFTGTVVLE